MLTLNVNLYKWYAKVAEVIYDYFVPMLLTKSVLVLSCIGKFKKAYLPKPIPT